MRTNIKCPLPIVFRVPNSLAHPLALAQYVTILVVGPGEEAMLARVTVLLGSWI